MQVNRYLKDKPMDWIDHALGRPVDPMAETYRNYFAADAGGDIAAHMAASPHWSGGTIRDDLQWFRVSQEGREALRDHLRVIGDPHRVYVVTWDGWQTPIVATSRAKARYSKWLDLSDSYSISFGDFCRTARVRLA